MSIVMITSMKCILIDTALILPQMRMQKTKKEGWQTRKMFTKTKYWKRMKKL